MSLDKDFTPTRPRLLDSAPQRIISCPPWWTFIPPAASSVHKTSSRAAPNLFLTFSTCYPQGSATGALEKRLIDSRTVSKSHNLTLTTQFNPQTQGRPSIHWVDHYCARFNMCNNQHCKYKILIYFWNFYIALQNCSPYPSPLFFYMSELGRSCS